MKKIILILVVFLAITSCKATARYTTPFETGGKSYKVALLPWKADTMSFTMRHRWTMTQALSDACKQAGVLEFAWSVYPVNGENVEMLEDIKSEGLWVRKKYGKYEPNIEDVLKILKRTDADCALLYVISADNGGTVDQGSSYSRDDYIRVFLIDAKTGQMIVDFIRTDFLRGKAFTDAKQIDLRVFNKWLFPETDTDNK